VPASGERLHGGLARGREAVRRIAAVPRASRHRAGDGAGSPQVGLSARPAPPGFGVSSSVLVKWICGERIIMERYLVELDGDQIELLKGLVRDAMKVADEKKVAALEGLISALGIMSWKAGDRRAD
jgi:hypothetical protein